MKKEDLLILKKRIKAKKPDFVRQEACRRKKLEEKWRQPKGRHSKLRRKFGGKRKHPGMGYCSPRLVKGLTMDGLKPVNVANLKDVDKIDPKTDVAVIAATGLKKKVAIIKKLNEKKVKILNIKEPVAYIKQVEDLMAKKKKEKEAKLKKKELSRKEKLKAAEEKKKKEEEEKSAEEKEKEAKEEQRKILEKKE